MVTDELIEKAMFRGRLQMLPWMIYFFAASVKPHPQPEWARWMEFGGLLLGMLAFRWYYSHHPLLPQAKLSPRTTGSNDGFQNPPSKQRGGRRPPQKPGPKAKGTK
jgi:hypothetical protein